MWREKHCCFTDKVLIQDNTGMFNRRKQGYGIAGEVNICDLVFALVSMATVFSWLTLDWFFVFKIESTMKYTEKYR